MEYIWHLIWNICETTISQDVPAWNIFTFAVFFLKWMHLHTKGRRQVYIILYLFQTDDPQKLAKLIIFITWLYLRFGNIDLGLLGF